MRLFRLKTQWLALIFSIVATGLHLGTFFLIRAGVGNGIFAGVWQRSLSFYWPAFDVVRILGFLNNVGPLTATIWMVITALLQWWIVFAVGIWLIRLYSRKPPISTTRKIVIGIIVAAVGVCFYLGIPETLGMSKYQRFRFDVMAGKTETVKETLRHHPDYAKKVQPGWGTALHEAARSGRVKIAEFLLNHGSDVNATDGEGETPLHIAVKWGGHFDVAKVLLVHKADVNARDKEGETPLWDAAASGYTNIIRLLLANGADVNARNNYGSSVLAGAVMNNRNDAVSLLLSHGADPTITDSGTDTVLDMAASRNNPSLAELLLPYFNGTNAPGLLRKSYSVALQYGRMNVAIPIAVSILRFESNSVFASAFENKSNDMCAQLNSHPGLLNARDFLGLTTLDRAIQGGHEGMVEILLSNGADVNLADQNGNAPLHWAVFMGQSNVVESLIEHKAAVDSKDARQMSPLDLAVQQGFVSIAGMLLKAGADANNKASGGVTPLFLAVANGNVEEVKLLNAYHADFNVRVYGGTLFHAWAMGSANLEVANVLLRNGCDVNARNSAGKTPLHVLIETIRFQRKHDGQIQAVQWLLDHNAEVNAKDKKGETPLALLQWHNRGRTIERRKDIGELLRKHGAKE